MSATPGQPEGSAQRSAQHEATSVNAVMKADLSLRSLLVELLVEELPPKALRKLDEAFSSVLAASLKAQGLASADAVVTSYATPRRLAVHVTGVAAQAPDKTVSQKLMPVTVGMDAAGNPTPALLKKLQALGADASAVPGLQRAMDGKAEALYYRSVVAGATLAQGLQKALDEAIAKLPIPKVMSYQLQSGCELPGWSSVSFVRPVHGVVALYGTDVVPVHALGLQAGNSTLGHRFEAAMSPVVIADADSYAATLARDGAVIAGYTERRADVVRQLADAAAKVGAGSKPIEDEALIDEVTSLVERPNVLLCSFEREFLEVPQECLILTMKANQKYFPLLDAEDKLTNKFLVVSNISPADPSSVIEGNERVVRPRLADAKFFFDQDRKKTLESRVEGLSKVVYHNKLGTQGERMGRVVQIAAHIVQLLGAGNVSVPLLADAMTAARLAKTDLLTDMVGEFPELQGTMGGYYARHDGLSEDVALAIEDHYRPRFAGDALPRNEVGKVVALADKLETLVGMFGIGNVPTGDKDPFALRRHALGVIRLLVDQASLRIDSLIEIAAVCIFQAERQKMNEAGFKALTEEHPVVIDGVLAAAKLSSVEWAVAFDYNLIGALRNFIYERYSGTLREQGYSSQEVDAVMSLKPQRFGDVPKRLAAVRAFAALPEALALAAANKRIGNILKKAPEVDAHVSDILLKEPAEIALFAAMKDTLPTATAQFDAGDYTAALQTLAVLRAPVDAFFEGVMVNAEEPDVRLNRLGLLKSLHQAMNRVADLSRLDA